MRAKQTTTWFAGIDVSIRATSGKSLAGSQELRNFGRERIRCFLGHTDLLATAIFGLQPIDDISDEVATRVEPPRVCRRPFGLARTFGVNDIVNGTAACWPLRSGSRRAGFGPVQAQFAWSAMRTMSVIQAASDALQKLTSLVSTPWARLRHKPPYLTSLQSGH